MALSTGQRVKKQIPVNEVDLFEEAVECIKIHEGMHGHTDYPYVGYGHRLLKGEKYKSTMSCKEAERLLRKDLLLKCAKFREYGKDSLILGVLAYNVGEYAILGHGKNRPSKLIKMIRSGKRNVRKEYVTFSMYKGKRNKAIYKRREAEYDLLFNKTKPNYK